MNRSKWSAGALLTVCAGLLATSVGGPRASAARMLTGPSITIEGAQYSCGPNVDQGSGMIYLNPGQTVDAIELIWDGHEQPMTTSFATDVFPGDDTLLNWDAYSPLGSCYSGTHTVSVRMQVGGTWYNATNSISVP